MTVKRLTFVSGVIALGAILWLSLPTRGKETEAVSGIEGARLWEMRDDGHAKVNGNEVEWLIPLTDPDWRPSTNAAHMRPDDPVMGFTVRGQSWALPWWVMKNHHVANLTIEGQQVLIAFCEKCSSGLAFDPVLKGRRLTFRIVGVYNGSILMSDFETNTYWSPFTGAALEGPLKGETLSYLEFYQCLWKEWLDLHPGTMVAYAPEEQRRGHGAIEAPGLSNRERSGFLSSVIAPLDTRLEDNDPVLGVMIGRTARAYPLSVLDKAPGPEKGVTVVSDTLGTEEIVILRQRGSWLTSVFNRRLGSETLQFASDKDGQVVDLKYQSRWNQMGEALDGPLKGRKLSFVPSRVEEWYIWAAFRPGTEIFKAQ